MSLTIAAAELEQLELAQSAIVSRLEHDHTSDWHEAVSGALRAVAGADHATLFQSGPVPMSHLTTYDEAATREYLAHYVHRDPVTREVAAREIECGCAWDVITPQALRETEFYNDYVRRHALYDVMSFRIANGSQSHLWLTLHSEREAAAAAEVRRRVSVLRLLLPSLRAAVQMDGRLAAWTEDGFRTIDDQREGVLLWSTDRRIVHVNPALSQVLAADPDGEAIRDAMIALARELLEGGPANPLPTVTRPVRTALGRFVAVAVRAGEPLAPAQAMVVLQRVTATDEELRRRYGLTAREVEVARLLAQGKRNADVAAALEISPYTARRHTERVLLKLGARTRAEVAGRLGE